MKRCSFCNVEFTPKKQTSNYCSLKCFNNRNKRKIEPKFDVKQFIWDFIQIVVPILILAFIVFKITPKLTDFPKEEVRALRKIPNSSCDDFEFIDDNEEGLKFRDFILKKRK